MGINRFFQIFLPKESKFFPLLKGQTEDLIKAADLLITFVHTSDHDKRKIIYSEIKQVETHCDKLTDQIFDELNKTFITPFDREDIHALASQIDDVLDMINASAKRIILYKPEELSQSMRKMADYIKEGVICIEKAIDELDKLKRNPKEVRIQCTKLHEIENSADDVYENFIIALFENEKNAIELVKQVEIIQLLENTTDKAYRIADVLKTIIVKYA